MKKILVTSLSVALIAVIAAGCASTPKGPTDEELITKRIQDGVTALKAKNYDAFSGMVSPSFSSNAVGSRDDLLAYLKNADSMGFLDALEVDLSTAKILVQGTKASVAPVIARGNFGSITLEFQGAKENGTWVITEVEPGF